MLADKLAAGQSVVLACSALKESYRRVLHGDLEVCLVYLKGDMHLMHSRLETRRGHYMPPALLQNQFDTLWEPRDALTVEAKKSVDDIVLSVLVSLALSKVSTRRPFVRP